LITAFDSTEIRMSKTTVVRISHALDGREGSVEKVVKTIHRYGRQDVPAAMPELCTAADETIAGEALNQSPPYRTTAH
jgi:hypothetical protein